MMLRKLNSKVRRKLPHLLFPNKALKNLKSESLKLSPDLTLWQSPQLSFQMMKKTQIEISLFKRKHFSLQKSKNNLPLTKHKSKAHHNSKRFESMIYLRSKRKRSLKTTAMTMKGTMKTLTLIQKNSQNSKQSQS